ncbi:DUF5610 domain-containing protein [Allochromatium humboldtianum]|uniref:DUF5610 domain-containing protein n=1 Tax=Allochromatium humboldtianum TaxID=504901 RepID=A0A850R5Y7_9GAMM|nr:DUF5610 domain-containing protein [Allochromatium humboldtianum]NVZ09154.1 DUF5610 domain-containing protein [Allochromatium humboldtianum]
MSIQAQFSSLVSNSLTLRSHTQVGAQAGSPSLREPAGALSSLQEKALGAIAREIPGMDVSGLKKLDPNEYTPEKVADRITSFVAMGLENARARGKSEEEIQALYESAVKGAEQGFKEAKDILSNLKVLEGNVAEQVDATEKLTFEGLAKLSPTQPKTETEATQAPSTTSGVAVAERYQQAEDFSLKLKTRDGDEVEISFSRNFEAQGRFGFSQDGEGNSAAVLDVSQSEKTGYGFSVKGDLSEDELKAIQTLVQDVGKLAKDFFGGDVQKAFEQAPDVRFDSSQLASMNLTMSRSESYSAARVYEGTQRLEQPESVQNAGRRLGHMMRELRDSFERPELGFLSQPDRAASDIMRGLVEQDGRFQQASPDQQGLYEQNLSQLLNSITPPQESDENLI